MAVLIERCVLMSRAATLDCFSRSVPHLHTDRANNTQNERAGDSGRRGGECARGTPVGCGWARSGPSVAPRSPDARVGIDAPTKLLHRAHRSPRRLCARALQRDICVDGQRCGFRRRGRAGVRGEWCAPQTCALKGDSEGISRAKPKPEGKGGATTTSRPSPVISCTPSTSSCVRRTPSTPSSRSSRLAAPSFALRLPRDMRVNVSRLGSCRRDAAGCQRPARLRRGRGPRPHPQSESVVQHVPSEGLVAPPWRVRSGQTTLR